jgi:hypothetical protein
MKTLLAVLALALGLAADASAQAPEFRRPQPKPKKQGGSVKIIDTDQPAEQTPSEEATTAQTATTPPGGTPAMAPPPGAAATQGSQPRDEMAVTAGRDWLALVDAGQFADSYDQAGELFRGALPRDQWAAALGASRKPHGSVVQRNLKSILVTKDLSAAQPGKYVVITFETTFQNPSEAMWEVLTSYLNASGQWKVVGYQVKPQEAGKPAK